MKTPIVICVAVVALCLCGCGKSETSAPTDSFDNALVSMGRDIAKAECAVCHNVELNGTSPRADAPPLRSVLNQLNISALADDFREHMHVGHPDMPDFEFTVKQTEGLLAYLVSIQDNASGKE